MDQGHFIKTDPILVFIHSPLVGPFTWAPVADVLREEPARPLAGIAVVVPALTSPPDNPGPYWARHAGDAAAAVAARNFPPERAVLLVGHSGAGPLLPAVRQAIGRPAAGYIFVDAGWPEDGKSRLDLFEDAQAAEQFRQEARAGLLPPWSDTDLQEVIPDAAVRGQFVSELRPLPLVVYEEALPVFAGWPDAPCAYLRFGDNPAYDRAWALARQAGGPRLRLEGQHFQMLVNPREVAGALLSLAAQMGIRLPEKRA